MYPDPSLDYSGLISFSTYRKDMCDQMKYVRTHIAHAEVRAYTHVRHNPMIDLEFILDLNFRLGIQTNYNCKP